MSIHESPEELQIKTLIRSFELDDIPVFVFSEASRYNKNNDFVENQEKPKVDVWA